MDYHNLCLGCMEEKDAGKNCPRCGLHEGAGPESALHLPPGTVLQDKYLLGRALGQGGFGITYLAWDLNLNLKLAIKEYLPLDMASRATGQNTVSVYKKELAGSFQYGLDKYLEEARTLARFAGHPSIVWVRDFFKANGTAYIVMEYVEGATLKEYLQTKQKPLSFEQALDIFMPVLDALKEVHAAGILHRDISPDNLLISNRGRVVLIDFGAARQAVGEQSQSLSVIMKPGFSPEEQYHSRGKQGPWTDIYAVAASIYCTITGSAPPESLSRLSEDTLVAPSKLGIKIDPPLENALLKALAVKAEDRYQVVDEFQRELVSYPATSQAREGYTTAKPKEPEKKPEPPEKPEDRPTQVPPSYPFSKKTINTAAFVAFCGLLIFGGISLLGGGEEASDPAFYYIDYENGTIPLGDLPIGARVVDPGWEWEYRLGLNYSNKDWVVQLREGYYWFIKTGDPTPPGDVKPVTWIVVAHDHYDMNEGHVTLLSEELIGLFIFDDSINRGSFGGSNHWGESGTTDATRGLRPWLNSSGIHIGEGFYQAFSEDFINAVLTTTVPNRERENGAAYSTQEHVFLPSTTELGDIEHNWTYPIGSVYPYFLGAGDTQRVAKLDGEAWCYWTRSPYSHDDGGVCDVTSAGEFFVAGADGGIYDSPAAYGAFAARPALNLKSEILVSEIKH